MEKKKTLFSSIHFGLAKEKEYLIENLSFLAGSGMPVSQALLAIQEELKSSQMKKIVGRVRDAVENGTLLSKALEETGLFGTHAISLIRSGEESGTLSQNLHVIAEQDAKNRLFKSRLHSALMYPILILVVTGLVGISVAWFILPKLSTVFSQLHVKLPFITQIVIGFGQFLGDYGIIAVPAFMICILLAVYLLFYNEKTRVVGQYILFAVPGIWNLIQELEIARMGYLLGTLMKSGLPVVQAIGSLKESTLSPFFLKFYAYLYESIEKGNSFEQSFAEYPNVKDILPSAIRQVITAGEQSGNLSTVLIEVGAKYEAKTELSSKNLAVALEPVMLVIVWLGVVMVALAVILPIYSLIGGVNK